MTHATVETATGAVLRPNLYAEIHKAIRSALSHALVQVGRLDTQDETELASTLHELRDLLRICTSHLHHEDRFVHAAMEARRPGSSATTDGDHRHHEAAILALQAVVDELAAAPAEARAGVATRLYAELGRFTAENLEHMAVEETQNNAALWDAYTDGELYALEGALIASLTPEEMGLAMRWMIPALTPQERAAKLAAIREKAPAPVFHSLLGLARTHLSARDWSKLSEALDLPASA